MARRKRRTTPEPSPLPQPTPLPRKTAGKQRAGHDSGSLDRKKICIPQAPEDEQHSVASSSQPIKAVPSKRTQTFKRAGRTIRRARMQTSVAFKAIQERQKAEEEKRKARKGKEKAAAVLVQPSPAQRGSKHVPGRTAMELSAFGELAAHENGDDEDDRSHATSRQGANERQSADRQSPAPAQNKQPPLLFGQPCDWFMRALEESSAARRQGKQADVGTHAAICSVDEENMQPRLRSMLPGAQTMHSPILIDDDDAGLLVREPGAADDEQHVRPGDEQPAPQGTNVEMHNADESASLDKTSAAREREKKPGEAHARKRRRLVKPSAADRDAVPKREKEYKQQEEPQAQMRRLAAQRADHYSRLSIAQTKHSEAWRSMKLEEALLSDMGKSDYSRTNWPMKYRAQMEDTVAANRLQKKLRAEVEKIAHEWVE